MYYTHRYDGYSSAPTHIARSWRENILWQPPTKSTMLYFKCSIRKSDWFVGSPFEFVWNNFFLHFSWTNLAMVHTVLSSPTELGTPMAQHVDSIYNWELVGEIWLWVVQIWIVGRAVSGWRCRLKYCYMQEEPPKPTWTIGQKVSLSTLYPSVSLH